MEQDGNSAGEQCCDRLPFAASRQESLHDELIGAMAGRSQKSSADEAGPKCVRLPEVKAEVENPQLVRAIGHAVNSGPPSGNQVKDGEQTYDRSANINYGLHNIGPDHCRQASLRRYRSKSIS